MGLLELPTRLRLWQHRHQLRVGAVHVQMVKALARVFPAPTSAGPLLPTPSFLIVGGIFLIVELKVLCYMGFILT